MKPKLILAMSILLLTCPAFAEEARQVPLLFNLQSALVDEGGNLLPDGSTELTFRVLDSSGAVLYEESQDLEVAKGQVSAIVGNGLAPSSGAPTGGIPANVFDPTDTLYLQVTAAGQKPYDLMQIVTVPYALWADTALSLPDGAITSAMIGEGVITKEHLDAELFAAIFPNGIPKAMLPSDTVYTDDFQGFKNTIQSTYGAAKVGVTTAFIYSGSQTVQGVLSDLDLAIKKRQEEVEFAKKDYGAKVGAEETARKDADTTLQSNINAEVQNRQTADTNEAGARQNADANEAAARQNADTILQNNFNNALTNEANTRAAGDGTLQSNINAEAGARQGADTSILDQLGSHTGATSAHGSNGAVVGVDTLNTSIANHAGLTATHGVSGDIVGTIDQQILSSKTLSMPNIQGGTVTANLGVSSGKKIDGVDISAHRHSGSGDGETLFGYAIWTQSDYADDDTYTGFIPSNMYDGTCGIAFGLAAMEIEDGLDLYCAKACKDPDNKRFRIRCLTAGGSPEAYGPDACSILFNGSNIYGDSVAECDTKEDTSGVEACRISYRQICIK